MSDPGSSMSLTAVLVLTVVVLVCIAGWLAVVFRAGSEHAGRPVPGGDGAGRDAEPGAGSRSQAAPAAHGEGEPAVPGG
jgi:hypothetical protein